MPIAFLTAIAIPAKPQDAPSLWQRYRAWRMTPKPGQLDLRPAIRSLEQNPQDWHFTEFLATHLPSNHKFWIAAGPDALQLRDTACSCTGIRSQFSRIQAKVFCRTVDMIRLRQVSEINQQFASHFE